MRSVTGKPSKFDAFVDKLKKESPIHISKRVDMPAWKQWLIRLAAIVVALFICAIITVSEGGDFGGFFVQLGNANFMQLRNFIVLLQETAILLLIALAITPAFKMKFWNIGAEGQVLMGGLMCATCMFYLGGKMSNSALIVVMLIASIAGGAIWAVIPALFKAKWNTNETLFTLMLNYIAMGLISFVLTIWVRSGSGVLGVLRYGQFPRIGNQPYVLNIIIVAIITVLIWIYLRFSKHGYELSVVGESINTAKYIGISVPKVIIRTMLLSGALCGIAGWLLVGGTSYSITTNTAGGRGFTAILISWLGHFEPISMVVFSLIAAFLSKGASQVALTYHLSGSFPEIITSIFFFAIIACEFFNNYKVKFNFAHFKKSKEQGGEATTAVISDSEREDGEKGIEDTAEEHIEQPTSEGAAFEGKDLEGEVTE